MQRDECDRVLWTLNTCGGLMTKSELAWRMHIELEELDILIRELERIGKIKLAEVKGMLGVGLRGK